MSTFNSDDICKTAHLARLAFSDAEMPALEAKLSGILAYAEQIGAVDTTAIEPLAHPLELTQRTRTDDVTETDQRTAYQAIAPDTEAGLYLVPQVIE